MIPQGYKQTEIGVIPEEWKIASLKDLSDGRFTYGVNAPAIPYAPPLPNYIRITDISDDGRFMRESRTSVDCQNPEMYTLKENDIVFARTGASTGKTYLYRKNDGDLVYAGFLIKASILPEKANSKYVFDNLHTNRYWDWVSVTSMRSGQPGINGNEYASYMIPCPSLPEQEHIAEVLSDVDSMISSLEKLIAKKKAIKQGAMQELLTGKKRLPGFTGEWHHEPFGKLCTICRGGSPRPIQDYLTTSDSGINWIKIGDVKPNAKYITSTQEKIVESGVSMSRRVYKGDFILSNSMSFGRPYILKLDGCIHDGWLAIQDYQVAFDTDFLYYVLGSNYVFEQYIQMAAGSSVQNLNKEKVAQLKLYIPALEEQTAIASILSDMDNEIEALEQKLAKTRQIKQGMMQQLLTGKIRLV
jgi:type I restriction enzyme S subunit